MAGDLTHWELAGGAGVEVLNVLDDHSRLLVASDARRTTKAADVVASFRNAAGRHGFPASVLTDNAAVFTAAPRGGGRCGIEIELFALGISFRHSTPYHPQTWSGSTRPSRSGSRSSDRPDRSPARGPARVVPRLLQH
jgi:Integrase core domain